MTNERMSNNKMHDIKIEDAIKNQNTVFIDVRSPVEYEDATIPEAVNIPLFTNEEREKIGRIYKQDGAEKAKWAAMEMVSPKIPSLMSSIKQFTDQGKVPVVFCWRGGMRSKSVATFAGFSGLHVYRLHGGYRSYRQWVLQSLSAELLPAKLIVLHGMTGIGKTQILHELKKRNHPFIDLEGMANHRGSVFGKMGINRPNNQKQFDANLYHQLLQIKDQPYAFMEAESKRIGKVALPDFLMEAKQSGHHILLTAPISIRVERTFQEYVEPYQNLSWFEDSLQESIKTIEKRLAPDARKDVHQYVTEKNYRGLIRLLFEHYYDPRYQHKLEQYHSSFTTLDASDLDETVQQLHNLI